MPDDIMEANVDDGTLIPYEKETPSISGEMTMFDDRFVGQLEAASQNAVRVEKALMRTLVSISHEGDWIDFEGTCCLSSAGAERFMKHFPFVFTDWSVKKNEGSDAKGKWYTIIFSSTVHLWGRSMPCEGVYSTRDKFLGKTKEGYRPIEDINEKDIRAAAKHMCVGNGIKQMLGLRGIKSDRLAKIIKELGGDPGLIKGVTYAKGGNKTGDASAAVDKTGDPDKRKELTRMLKEMNNDDAAQMREQLITLTTFRAKDGNEVSFDSTTKMSGAALAIALKKTQEAYSKYKSLVGTDNGEMFT